MYEGYLQHDAQEVLQCILGYIQDACDTIRKEQQLEGKDNIHEESGDSAAESRAPTEADGQVSGKRKSDSEMGNPKKKPKSVKSKKSDEEEVERPLTRSRRKLSGIGLMNSPEDKDGDKVAEEMQKVNGETEGATRSNGDGNAGMVDGKRKKPSRLAWLRPSGKQPSIFSKFRRVGKISSMTFKNENKPEEDSSPSDEKKSCDEKSITNSDMDKKSAQHLGMCHLMIENTCFLCMICTDAKTTFKMLVKSNSHLMRCQLLICPLTLN